jgi:hypothetical protein
MATDYIGISEKLFARLRAEAEAAGKTVEEFASEVLSEGLREQKWQALVARGAEFGRKSGIREDEVVDVIHQWRNENRVR